MRTALLSLLAVGCVEVTPQGGLFEPAPGSTAPVSAGSAPVAAAPSGPQGGFDFEAEDRQKPADAKPRDLSALAGSLGISGVPAGQSSAPPAGAAPVAPPAPSAPPVALPPAPPVWTPGTPMAGSFGVRLVSTVRDAQPPRAILGLPSGKEEVVQPGTLLPEAGVVVLAIGRDVVQIAEITPQGDHARVEPRLLMSQYPVAPASP